MDKRSLIGLGLIGAILILWLTLSGPSKADKERNKRIVDSIARLDSINKVNAALAKAEEEKKKQLLQLNDTSKTNTVITGDSSKVIAYVMNDSIKQVLEQKRLQDTYSEFSAAAKGIEKTVTLENNKLKATFSNKGGKLVKLELKEYKRADKITPLILFDRDSIQQHLEFLIHTDNKKIITDSLFFSCDVGNTVVGNNESKSIKFKLATSTPGAFIEYVYILKGNDYLLDYEVHLNGLQNIISPTNNEVSLNWGMLMPSQELHIEKERQTATVYYKTILDNSVEDISPGSDERKSVTESELKWVAFKQQFFSSVLIAKDQFKRGNTEFITYTDKTNPDFVKSTRAVVNFDFDKTASQKFAMQFYFGPNHYNTLKKYDLGLERMVPTGWWIFSFINKWIVMPVFNWLESYGMNYGLIILILTLIIKLLLSPIAYKTYMSSAKMRLLKPELDVIKEKFGKDTMKINQENMAMYRKAGVSPLSGCIPALIQFPILIALLSFFPAAFELRQKEFLWADDLSTYDSIYTFGHVPVLNFVYGDHVSLFALLMFVSTIVYTWMNQKMMPTANTGMPGMKFMMYFMPFIFLSFMNSYSAGLSWYYFLANMITFAQTFLMRYIVSDSKLRAKLEANMKKPKKKSGFQARLEEMQKQRAAQARKR